MSGYIFQVLVPDGSKLVACLVDWMRKIEGLFGSDLAFFILFWGGDGVKPFPIVATRIYFMFFQFVGNPYEFSLATVHWEWRVFI